MVNKRDVKTFYAVARRLVKRTDEAVDSLLTTATGKSQWRSYVKGGVRVEMEDSDPDPEGDSS